MPLYNYKKVKSLEQIVHVRAHSPKLTLTTLGNNAADFYASATLTGMNYPPVAYPDIKNPDHYCRGCTFVTNATLDFKMKKDLKFKQEVKQVLSKTKANPSRSQRSL